MEAQIIEKTKDPLISIKLVQENNTIKIEIKDNGPPISSDVKEQIFIPFLLLKKRVLALA